MRPDLSVPALDKVLEHVHCASPRDACRDVVPRKPRSLVSVRHSCRQAGLVKVILVCAFERSEQGLIRVIEPAVGEVHAANEGSHGLNLRVAVPPMLDLQACRIRWLNVHDDRFLAVEVRRGAICANAKFVAPLGRAGNPHADDLGVVKVLDDLFVERSIKADAVRVRCARVVPNRDEHEAPVVRFILEELAERLAALVVRPGPDQAQVGVDGPSRYANEVLGL
mmetsp:Transcript_10648/g.34021  ORF Transcript_10648/g.34021 Transcript_10648/m.34021 type:complete len:224 (+) Transcript_10648:638-1309(+)